MDRRHRREVGEDLAERAIARRLGPPDDEFDTSRFELVSVAQQNRLDDGGCGEVGDVQDGPGAVDRRHRFA